MGDPRMVESRTHTMTSSTTAPVTPVTPIVIGGAVFSKIRCYLNPDQINRKLFVKPKILVEFYYNKTRKCTTKSEIVLSRDKARKRANWSEQIYFELSNSNITTEFHIRVYNTAITGPDGILGEAIENFDNIETFKGEENRITLPLKKNPRHEQIGEISFHLNLLSNKPPRHLMERVCDPGNRANKIGMLIINLTKFKNLAGRRGILEFKLNDETHSTDGYWNSTKDWKYAVCLPIVAKATLDLVIQCRYTEHERAMTRICLGPDGSHESIWRSLMEGPFELKQISLHDHEHDAARIGLLLSVYENVSPRILFNMNEETTPLYIDHSISESPICDDDEESIYSTKPIIERRCSSNSSEFEIPSGIRHSKHDSLPSLPHTSDSIDPKPILSRKKTPTSPQAVSSTNGTPSIPFSHPRKISIEEDEELESVYSDYVHIPVNNSPPKTMIEDYDFRPRDKDSFSSSTGSPPYPSTPPQSSHAPTFRKSSASSVVSSPPRRHNTISSPPPYRSQNPHPKNDDLKFVCQRYVIANQLRLGQRKEENPLYPQNKVYKGNHVLSGLNVIIKEFSSKLSWEIETQYLKELTSKHTVKWIDRSSNDITGEYFSITEYYGRSLQLDVRKFKDEDSKRSVFKNISSAVDWIHGKDVVHLDLNPSNIICKEGRGNYKVKICDFETSRQFGDIIQIYPVPSDAQSVSSIDTRYSGSQNQVFQQQFTISYTCPELLIYEDNGFVSSQNNGVEVDIHPNMDIYSLGCILYFLYTSTTLYSSSGELDEKLMLERGFEDKVKKDIKNQKVAELINKCINVNPRDRPDIRDVIDDIYFNERRESDGCGEEEDSR